MSRNGGRPPPRRLEALGHLTGGVAHDLNNLLMIVLGNVEMLEDIAERESGENREMLRSLSKTALAATERASMLSRRLAGFARRHLAEPGGAPLHASLKTTGDLIERALGRRTTLLFDLAAEHDLIETDVQQLETALVLLAVAGEESASDREVVLSTRNVGDAAGGLRIAVTVEHRDGATAAEEVLGFARAVAESGGGTLEAPAPSSVTLLLPASEDVDAAMAVQPGLVALLVDAREACAAMTATQLRRLGCRPTTVSSADAAREVLKSETGIDLLISEADLGYGADGIALIRDARVIRPGLPALLVADTLGLAAASASHGDLGLVLPRPFTQRELADLLSEAISDG